jgi:hypothetical protein
MSELSRFLRENPLMGIVRASDDLRRSGYFCAILRAPLRQNLQRLAVKDVMTDVRCSIKGAIVALDLGAADRRGTN